MNITIEPKKSWVRIISRWFIPYNLSHCCWKSQIAEFGPKNCRKGVTEIRSEKMVPLWWRTRTTTSLADANCIRFHSKWNRCEETVPWPSWSAARFASNIIKQSTHSKPIEMSFVLREVLKVGTGMGWNRMVWQMFGRNMKSLPRPLRQRNDCMPPENVAILGPLQNSQGPKRWLWLKQAMWELSGLRSGEVEFLCGNGNLLSCVAWPTAAT